MPELPDLGREPESQKSQDTRWMQRALELARDSIGLASPNPVVGCVLVKAGRVVGEGFHEYDRKDHAEIVALKRAGEEARGATAYVTLEPCAHTGRTGPCANALIAAGVARVVVATGDPNPLVNSQGIARLKAAHIDVEVGVCMDEARELNDGFARHIRSGLPFVTLKAGLSLDGRLAPTPGRAGSGHVAAPVFLTGEAARVDVQRLRHASDAIITGINTALTDNPRLTDRSGLPRRLPLLRVVLDSALRLRLDSQLVRTAREDLLVFCIHPNHERQKALQSLGVKVEVLEGSSYGSRVSLIHVLERLGSLGITSALFEAGSQVNASLLSQNLVDKLVLYYAPITLGASGVPFVTGTTEMRMPWQRTTVRQFGPDIRIEGYLRDPWA